MTRPTARTGSVLRVLMPYGTPLPDADWTRRHGTINALAMAHIPIVFVFGLLVDVTIVHAVVETVPVAAGALLGLRSRHHRRVAELATTFSLISSSAVLVHLSGGFVELHFHFFVIVALVTLYQQWEPFLFAIAFVALHHGIVGVLEPTAVYNHPAAIEQPWTWAAIHAAFIAMASAVGIANWKLNELSRHRAENYFRRLYEGEIAVVQRLEEADRVKGELVAAVSHEFRTPLTVILGLAQTLSRNPEAAASRAADFAERIHRQGRRLEQLVDNLLQAEEPIDAGGSCDARAAAMSGIGVAAEGHPLGSDAVSVRVTEDLTLPLAPNAAHVIMANLISNALKFASPKTPVELRVRPSTEGGVVIEVSNEGPEVPHELRERIFEPFVQGDSSNTREADGIGLGLHVVRRIVTVNHGRIAVTSSDGVTTFTVWLPAKHFGAASRLDPPPADATSDRSAPTVTT